MTDNIQQTSSEYEEWLGQKNNLTIPTIPTTPTTPDTDSEYEEWLGQKNTLTIPSYSSQQPSNVSSFVGDAPDETRKAQYGMAKESMTLGSAYRFFTAATGWGTTGDTYEERSRDAWNQHMQEVWEEFPEFKDGKYDSDIAVIGGQMATIMADPILWIPWIGWGGKAYKAGSLAWKSGQYGKSMLQSGSALAGLGGATAGADMGIRMLDQEGRIDPKIWGTSVGLGAALSAAIPGIGTAGRMGLNKAFPTLFSNKAVSDDVIKAAINKIDERNITSNLSLDKIQKIATTPSVKAAIQALQDNTLEFQRYQRMLKLFDDAKTDTKTFNQLSKQIKNFKPTLKNYKTLDSLVDKKTKLEKKWIENFKDTGLKKKDLLINRRVELSKAQKTLQSQVADEYDNAIKALTSAGGEYIGEITKQLYAKGGAAALSDKVIRGILASTVYPTFGGVVGGMFGVLAGDDNEDMINWAIGGAMLMGAYRFGIQGRNYLPKKVADNVFGKAIREHAHYGMWKLKTWSGMTLATRLEGRGSVMGRFSNLLFQSYKGGTSSVEQNAGKALDNFKVLLFGDDKMVGVIDDIAYNSPQIQQIAMSLVRGGTKSKSIITLTDDGGKTFRTTTLKELKNLDKVNGTTIVKDSQALSKRINQFLEVHKNYLIQGGISPKEIIENYFPRVHNKVFISKNKEQFIKDIQKVLYNKAKKNFRSDIKNKGKKYNKKLSDFKGAATKYYHGVMKNDYENLITQGVDKKGHATLTFKTPIQEHLKILPKSTSTDILEHVELDRMLQGSYDLVEGPLSKYFVNDVSAVLLNMVNKSTKSVEFSKVFGKNGEGLIRLKDNLRKQYLNQGFINTSKGEQNDIRAMIDGVHAYFGRHGAEAGRIQRTTAALVSFLTNTRLMGTVSLANLGDIVQTFQNSYYFKTWMQGTAATVNMPRRLPFTTKPRKITDQPADVLYLHHDNVAKKALRELSSSAFIEEGDPNLLLRALSKGNEHFFKLVGLQDVTELGRRTAFNFGAIDGLNLARDIVRFTEVNGRSLGELAALPYVNIVGRKARRLYDRAIKMGIAKTDADGRITNLNEILKFGTFKNWKEAKADTLGSRLMSYSGRVAMDRDAIIPAVGNRMLFTQSKNPTLRLLGQFSSWAQAKSSQTNALLQRIENGEARLAVKMLMTIPVFTALHQLRRWVKTGFQWEDSSPQDALADGIMLSGNPGWLAGNVYSYATYNPREPLNFFPGAETIGSLASIGKDISSGRPLADIGLEWMENTNLWIIPPEYRRMMENAFPEELWWFNYDPVEERDFPLNPDFDLGFGIPLGFGSGSEIGFALGGLVGKAISKASTKGVTKVATKKINPGATQIKNTVATYEKYVPFLEEKGINFRNFENIDILDYGSGLGLGSRVLEKLGKTKSFEPFAKANKDLEALSYKHNNITYKGKVPEYKNEKTLIEVEGKNKFKAIISHAVLNVIPNPSNRAEVVKNIGKLLADDGVAIINTRPIIEGNPLRKLNDGFVMKKGDNETFQKGFKINELLDYIKSILGDGFEISKIPSSYKINGSAVMIKKV